MRDQEALELLRALTFEKVASLTAPTTGGTAPTLPQLGEQGGTRAQMALRQASENAQATTASTQLQVSQGAKGYSPPTGRKGTTGIGQSAQTAQRGAPKPQRLTQPKQEEGSRKLASIQKLAGIFDFFRRTARPAVSAADQTSTALTRAKRRLEPYSGSNWDPATQQIPINIDAQREAILRHNPRGPGNMAPGSYEGWLKNYQQNVLSGQVSPAWQRAKTMFTQPFVRAPSPPLKGYDLPEGKFLTPEGPGTKKPVRARREKPSEGPREEPDLMERGMDRLTEVIKPIVDMKTYVPPVELAPAIQAARPFVTSAKLMAGGAGLAGLAAAGNELWNRYSPPPAVAAGQPGGQPGGQPTGQPAAPLSPGDRARAEADRRWREIDAETMRELYGVNPPPPQ